MMTANLCGVFIFMLFVSAQLAQELIVTTKSGKILGKTAKDKKGNIFYSFQSIPYAKPPTGDLRFKAPVPIEPWKIVVNATRPSPQCPQNNRTLDGHEDCLFLNVYTPQLPKNSTSLLPVMVYIHGGGFHSGSSVELYGPEFIIADRGVVLTSMNYRLGMLGFLHLENEVAGNAAMKDQVLALKWIKDNVQYFNGNPNNITIFGESAGAGSVHYHILSPMSSDLFQRAIIQSGCALNLWAEGLPNNARVLGKALNISTNNDHQLVEALKKIPLKTLIEAQLKITENAGIVIRSPVSIVVESGKNETAFISQKPLDIIKSGKFNKVPFIIGYTSQEGILEVVSSKIATGHGVVYVGFESVLPYDLSNTSNKQTVAEKVRHFYYKSDIINASRILQPTIDYVTDIWFHYQINIAITEHLKASKEPIYFYRFSADTKLNYMKTFMPELVNYHGAAHGDDIFYLFKNPLTPTIIPGSVEDVSIERMVKLWTNFAKFGNPTPKNDSLIGRMWKPVTSQNLEALEIGNKIEIVNNPDLNRIKFWQEIYK